MSTIARTFHTSKMPTTEEADALARQLGIEHFGGDKNFRWDYSVRPAMENGLGEVVAWEVDARCWIDP